jgi:polyisoprenoid-binding protein YceI
MKTMKTKNLILGMIAAVGILFASCSQNAPKEAESASTEKTETVIDNIIVNAEQSRIIWSGEMLGVYVHEGTLNFNQASISMNKGKMTGGSFIANLRSIVPTDENYNAEKGNTQEKLVGHLSSADFFDVENFPTAKFEITSVAGNTAKGMLTIRGISNEETVENITITKEGENTRISGELVFDRKKYDVAWDSPMKDMVLSNDVKLKIELVGN